MYLGKLIEKIISKKPMLRICPNHVPGNALREQVYKGRYYDSRKNGPAISDGKGWYKKGGEKQDGI